jgi:hypothetical protein
VFCGSTGTPFAKPRLQEQKLATKNIHVQTYGVFMVVEMVFNIFER